MENSRVNVAVRIRPKLEAGVSATLQCNERYEKIACSASSETSLRLVDAKSSKDKRQYTFSFDNVFDVDATQSDVYEAAAVDAVDAALMGTNSSILTYGQTGSGKTFTILGGIRSSAQAGEDVVTEDTGVLMRAVEDMLHYVARMRGRRHVVLGISAVEIYLDEIRDLLSAQGAVIQASLVKDVVRFPNLTYVPLNTLSDAISVYQRAASKRVQRATAANDTSSRSHALFCIEIFQAPHTPKCPTAPSLSECIKMRDDFVVSSMNPNRRPTAPVRCKLFEGAANPLLGSAEMPVMFSKLIVSDLAGSEKAKHSDVTAEGFDELRKINSSLTALGNVVHHLFNGSKHIPYRDTKLTMALRDAFASPASRISLIVNVSPTVLTIEESLSSLYFADKVKGIKVPTAGVGWDAAAEEGYLQSLQQHDALLAEMRIFAVEQELMASGVKSALVKAPQSPLLARAPTGKKSSGRELRFFSTDTSREEKLRLFLEKAHQCARDDIVSAYRTKRETTKNQLKTTMASIQEAKEQHQQRSAELSRLVESEEKALMASQKEHHRRAEQRKGLDTDLRALNESAAALEPQAHPDRNPQWTADDAAWAAELSAHTVLDRQWDILDHLVDDAAHVAQLRHELVSLVFANAHQGIEPPTAVASHQGGSRQPDNSTPCTMETLEEWLQRVAVTMSSNGANHNKHRKTHGDTMPTTTTCKESRGNSAEPVPTNSISCGNSRYWTKKIKHDAEQLERPQRHSAYDDPKLREIIASYMEMGSPVRRVGKDGVPHRRMLYVVTKRGRQRISWDNVGQNERLGGAGYVELAAIERILLGQSTAGFDKCSERGHYHSSFSLAHSSKEGRGAKYLDIICDSVEDMESWVIGLSHATGLYPVFDDTKRPYDVSVDDGPGADQLTAEEAQLSLAWHIPPRTIAETKQQVNTRRMKRSRQMLSITPGELAGVTALDIFRASALWLHLNAQGLVENATKALYCYVEAPTADARAGRRQSSSPGVTDSATDGLQSPAIAPALGDV